MSLLIILNNIKQQRLIKDIKSCDECRIKIDCDGVKFSECMFGSLKNVQRNINYLNNRK